MSQYSNVKTFVTKYLEFRYLPFILAAFHFLVVFYVSTSQHQVGDYNLETDFYERYVPYAQKFLDGQFPIDGFQGPLYPIMLAVFKSITGDFMFAGQLINALGVSLFLLSIYLVFKKLFTVEVAAIAFLITAINRHYFQNTYSCGTDMLFLALLGGMMYFMFKDKEQKWINLILTGLFAGLAFLTRFNGLFMIVGVLFSYLVLNIYNTDWKNRFIASGVVFAVFWLIYTPYGLHTLAEKESFLFNTNYKNLAYTYLAEPAGVGWDQFWHTKWVVKNNINGLTDIVFADFGGFVSRYFSSLLSNINEDFNQLIGFSDVPSGKGSSSEFSLYGWSVGILFFLGAVSYIIQPAEDKRELAYGVLGLVFFGVLGLVFHSVRFSMFLLPFYLAFACRPFISQKVTEKLSFAPSIPVVVGLIFFFVGYKVNKEFNLEPRSMNGRTMPPRISEGPKEMLEVKKWFEQKRPNESNESVIFARKPHVAFYAGLKLAKFPILDLGDGKGLTYQDLWEKFHEKVKEKNVKYIYYGYWEYANRPQMRIFTKPKQVPKDKYRLVHYHNIPRTQLKGFLYQVID